MKFSHGHIDQSLLNLCIKFLVAFLKVKLFVENLRKGKKQYSSKTKGLIIQKLLNQFTQNEVHCHRLNYCVLAKRQNYKKISSLSPKRWGSSQQYLSSLKPQFLYYLLGCHKKKVAIPFILDFKRDVLMLHVHLVAHILYNQIFCLVYLSSL